MGVESRPKDREVHSDAAVILPKLREQLWFVSTTCDQHATTYHNVYMYTSNIIQSRSSYIQSVDLAYQIAAMQAVSGASCSLGIRIYSRNAALDHRPKAWMTESSSPAWAAAVAAPILKLWPAN